MTGDDIKTAARELCCLRGLNPDAPLVPGMPPQGTPTNAEALEPEVLRFVQVGIALANVRALPKAPRKRALK